VLLPADVVTAAGSLEVVTALDDFVTIYQRSPTLDGSIPVRAARGCKPVMEGSSAGFYIRLNEAALLTCDGSALAVQVTSETLAKVSGPAYFACVESLVMSGLLERDGYWHRDLLRAQ